MREIKFRAWDKKNNKMWHCVEELDLGNQEVVFQHNEDYGITWGAYPSDAILMQYTGLKDKNGTEIYEGDIMEWDEKEWGAPYREIVEWRYSLFETREDVWPQSCEVIGNIYENPELLTEGK